MRFIHQTKSTLLNASIRSLPMTLPTTFSGRLLARQILCRQPAQWKHDHRHLSMQNSHFALHPKSLSRLGWYEPNREPYKICNLQWCYSKSEKFWIGVGGGSLTGLTSTWVGAICHDAGSGKAYLCKKQALFNDACSFDLSVAADWLYWWCDETGKIYPQI